MKVLSVLFWFFFILYLLKFLFRIFAPILMSRFIKKTSQRFEQQFNQHQSNKREDEGKVSIDEKTSTDSNKKSDNIGDYVDFEEVDD